MEDAVHKEERQNKTHFIEHIASVCAEDVTEIVILSISWK